MFDVNVEKIIDFYFLFGRFDRVFRFKAVKGKKKLNENVGFYSLKK